MTKLLQKKPMLGIIGMENNAVLGAALRIWSAGGTSLNQAQMVRACGSIHLFKYHGETIIRLVKDFEAQEVDG